MKRLTQIAALALLVVAAGCTRPSAPVDIFDPYESRNREVHEFNKRVDRALLGPGAGAYGVVPKPVRRGVGNVADNLSTPGFVVNDLLQGQIVDAGHNTLRFALNTTVGLLGLVDVAGWLGLERRASDFGETLARWGVPEGAYLELPFVGPSTERDAAGKVVDLFTNPLIYHLPPEEWYVKPAVDGVRRFTSRTEFASSVESVLNDSADSYLAARSLYLQNRRFQVGDSTEDNYVDPYEDFENLAPAGGDGGTPDGEADGQ